MNKDDFKKFVEQKAEEAKQVAAIDWRARKEEWLRNLGEFYSIIEQYLADFVKAGNVGITSSSVFLTEERIGAYEAPSRTIFVGLNKVTLMPVGTLLIGAKGRVDMMGPAGSIKFILTGKHSNGIRISVTVQGEAKPKEKRHSQEPEVEEEYVWKIATPPPKVQFLELTPETFFNALTEVLNG